jgi:hypothetical protein
MGIILSFVCGALCGVGCTALAVAAKKRDGYDYDYYDHDVSGLLEED